MIREFPVPPSIWPRAQAWLAGSDGAGTGSPSAAPVAQPRGAATVMVLRPGSPKAAGAGDRAGAAEAAPVEVFMLRRTSSMAFAAGMHVFPGGGLDHRDADPSLGWFGPPATELAAVLGADPADARALMAAAVRETFEECGVLLAGRDSSHLVEDVADDDWERQRQALAAGQTSLADVLGGRGLGIRADLIKPWAHWITPPFERRRYDTRFFVAALPSGQQARDLGGEADHAHWLAPAEALRLAADGEAMLMPPTRVCLEELAAAAGLAEVLATPRTLRPVMPALVCLDDGSVLLRAELP
jgi:8-oxo-dGTP pyrophosphatase MutT (NUDIX family)